jgi:hypothetical protein
MPYKPTTINAIFHIDRAEVGVALRGVREVNGKRQTAGEPKREGENLIPCS